MLQRYERDKVSLPKMLRELLFTIIAKDNVDLNSSSNTPAGHYHGTSMTVLKFPLSTRPGKIRNIEYELTVCKILSKKVNKLPQSYTNVIQLNISKAPLFAPIFRYNIPECKPDVAEQRKEKEFYWLDSFSNCFQYDSCQPWSKYHGSHYRKQLDLPGINTILPLLGAQFHMIDTQYHCMIIIKNTIEKLNPSQTPVDTCDQPVYALRKELQWRRLLQFENYFSLFPGMHIEQSMQDVHGDIIDL